MSLDDTINLDRLATAFEKIAVALQERNRIELDRLAKSFPPEKEKRAAEVIHPEKDKREQYSDRGSPEWFDETEKALPDSKFKLRFDAANKQTEASPQKRRRVVEVPTKH